MKGKDARRCKRCRFHSLIAGREVVCDYILIMKKPRGCPPGVACTVSEPLGAAIRREHIIASSPKRFKPEPEGKRECKACPHRSTRYRDGKVISYCPLLNEEVDPDVTTCRIIV